MFEKIRPLHDRVLVKRIKGHEKTAGGLFIPDAAQEKAQTCEVIAIGNGKVTNDGRVLPMAVKAGDVVFIGKYAGTEAGDEHLIIREDEILGILG